MDIEKNTAAGSPNAARNQDTASGAASARCLRRGVFPGLPDPRIRRLYWTADAEGLPALERGRAALAMLGVREGGLISGPDAIPTAELNKGTVLVTGARGEAVHPCRCRRDYLCCGYYSIDLYEGCSIGCTYCALQAYLDFGPVVVRADPESAVAHLRTMALASPERLIRAGSGELGDSLLYDSIFDLSRIFIEGLADLPNVRFEMKTKTADVAHLLNIEKKGRAVIGFSVNAPEISASEEAGAAPLAARLEAAQNASAAGYQLAFHFDPVFADAFDRGGYRELLDMLRPFKGKAAWASIGALRYAPSLRDCAPPRPWMGSEMLPGPDGKLRYLMRRRVAIFRNLVPAIREVLDAPVYLCMEYPPVWDAVFGGPPSKVAGLGPLFD